MQDDIKPPNRSQGDVQAPPPSSQEAQQVNNSTPEDQENQNQPLQDKNDDQADQPSANLQPATVESAERQSHIVPIVLAVIVFILLAGVAIVAGSKKADKGQGSDNTNIQNSEPAATSEDTQTDNQTPSMIDDAEQAVEAEENQGNLSEEQLDEGLTVPRAEQ